MSSDRYMVLIHRKRVIRQLILNRIISLTSTVFHNKKTAPLCFMNKVYLYHILLVRLVLLLNFNGLYNGSTVTYIAIIQ